MHKKQRNRIERDIRIFTDDLERIPFLKPDGNPEPTWQLFTAPTWREAAAIANAEAEKAAGGPGAFRDHGWFDARRSLRDFANACEQLPAFIDMLKTAYDAYRTGTPIYPDYAGYHTAFSSDASLMAMIFAASHLDISQQHREHAAARMRVWKKGYCLDSDVNGVLYVYAKAK